MEQQTVDPSVEREILNRQETPTNRRRISINQLRADVARQRLQATAKRRMR